MIADPSTDGDGAVPTAPSDAGGGFTLPPFDLSDLFPRRDAGRPRPVDAGRDTNLDVMTVTKRIGPRITEQPSGDGIGLILPRGAATRNVDITFAALPSPPAGFVGRAFLITPADTRFALPVQVAIQLTPELLALAPATELAVATLANGAWVALPNQVTGPDNLFVAGSTQVLGPFALIRVPARVNPDASVPDASVPDAAVDAAVSDAAAGDAALDAGPTTFCQPGACANGTCIEGTNDFGCACNAGFTLAPDLHSCQDVDECAAGTLACSGGKVCSNTSGGAQCACPAGTELTPADTCAAPGTYCLPTSCAPGTCVQGAADFSCSCPTGYAGTKTCEDVDECATGTACPANQTCTNSAGSFACACVAPNVTHVDGSCGPPYCVAGACANGTCAEAAGGFVCTCNPGFSGTGTQACSDVDECMAGTFSCPAPTTQCQNTVGSYSCICPAPTLPQPDGTCL